MFPEVISQARPLVLYEKKRKMQKPQERKICGECFEILGIEVEHETPSVSQIDDQFAELEIRFNRHYIIRDWRTFPTIKNGNDLWKIADYIVKYAISIVASLDGYDSLSKHDHSQLLSLTWHQMLQWFAVYSSSQDGIFYNIRDSNNMVKALPTRLSADFSADCHQVQLACVLSFPLRWRWDKRFMSIFLALIYYNSDVKELQDSPEVERIHGRFLNQLGQYLTLMYGGDEQAVSMAHDFAKKLVATVRKTAISIRQTLISSQDAIRNAKFCAQLSQNSYK